MTERYLIDAYDLGVNDKGIHRVLASLVPRLHARTGSLVAVTTPAGADLLAAIGVDTVVVARTRQSIWEQWGLPRIAGRLGCAATYSHREAGALWGPPLVLHVPEDPGVRWAREPAQDAVAHLRRAYSRAVMARSLRHASVVATSVPAVGRQLTGFSGVEDIATIPLGVDLELFTPATRPHEDAVFHLGSPDPRDGTTLVIEGYAVAAQRTALPPLIIGGSLGDTVGPATTAAIDRLGLEPVVHLVGRLSDTDLASAYRDALVVIQPASDEGFGLQPLEALASGAPLVVVDTPAVADVVGDAAMRVHPSVAAVADAVVAIASAPDVRAGLRTGGPGRAAPYTWGRSADAVLESLRRAAESAGQDRSKA